MSSTLLCEGMCLYEYLYTRKAINITPPHIGKYNALYEGMNNEEAYFVTTQVQYSILCSHRQSKKHIKSCDLIGWHNK